MQKSSALNIDFDFTSDTTIVSYVGHKVKCTIVMNAMHHRPDVEDGSKKIPEIISYYNSTKG